jgi:AcrR family transcriptional regulator
MLGRLLVVHYRSRAVPMTSARTPAGSQELIASNSQRLSATTPAALVARCTRGFHATSVDQVAERAGYTKGAVYSNFASKATGATWT